MKAETVNQQLTSLDSKAWPAGVVKVSNNIGNQFEIPVLFYILCVVLYISAGGAGAAIALAWAYVLSRYAHAFVHVGSNYVPVRMGIFFFGCFILLVMTLMAATALASGNIT